MTNERLAAFSDGVFAFAITLLVLDLHVPAEHGHATEPLLSLLHSDWTSYLAFLCSFYLISIKWINHHNMVHEIERVDNGLLALNMLLLLFVCVVPFTTSLLADYATDPLAYQATMLYAAVWSIGGLTYTLFWVYAVKRGLVSEKHRRSGSGNRIVRYALGPVGYLFGGLVSLINVYAAIAIFIIVASTYLFPDRPSKQPS